MPILMAQTQILAPMPPQSSTFAGNVRGYWFTAPSCFTITGVEVPTDASTGPQNIAIVRFPAAPPVFSVTTNVFTLLHLTQNGPTSGIIPVNIQVEQGDVIGVLGQRSNVNSYGNPTIGTTIEGIPVALARLGMQFPLGNTAPQDLWQEPTSTNLSRVNLYYDSLITFTASNTLVGGSTFSFNTNADTSFSALWDFGDGSPLDTTFNPQHTYSSNGSFNACLYVTTSCGTDTVCTLVNVCNEIVPAFSYSVSGLDLTVSDSSQFADSVFWDFGDGTSGVGLVANHSYAVPDTYWVCQIVTSLCDSDTLCQQVLVCAPPAASFGVNSITRDSVAFTDSSLYATSYSWDFGDGGSDSVANPVHVYTQSGTYTVCLFLQNPCGVDTLCRTLNVCLSPPVAAFSASDTLLTVRFFNGSSGASNYSWDFGDGGIDTSASPVHAYNGDGTYLVCLTAFNLCGDSTVFCDTLTITSVGIWSTMPGFNVSISPNPVTNESRFLLQADDFTSDFVFSLVDLSGRLVFSVPGRMGEAQIFTREGIPAGLYVFRFEGAGTIYSTGRIVIQ